MLQGVVWMTSFMSEHQTAKPETDVALYFRLFELAQFTHNFQESPLFSFHNVLLYKQNDSGYSRDDNYY